MTFTNVGKLGLLSASIALAISNIAIANEQANQIEVIEVTSQKRVQTLQEVPVSVTVFSADDIERSKIEGFSDYAIKTPNIGFAKGGTAGETRFSIRGVTNVGGQANSVGIYVDEVNVVPNVLVNGVSRTADTRLFDAERIEVLRGPQSTFFGRNTMGGAISITTIKPNTDENSVSVEADFSEFDTQFYKTSANVALSETFAVSVRGFTESSDGWLDNDVNGDAVNSTDNYGYRVAAMWEASNDVTVNFSTSKSDAEQDHPSIVASGNLPEIPSQVLELDAGLQAFTGGAGLFNGFVFGGAFEPLESWPLDSDNTYPSNDSDISSNRPIKSDSTTDIHTLNVTWDINPNLSLTAVTGYIENDYSAAGDGDLSKADSFYVSRESEMSAFSQELRLNYGDQKTTWMLGAIVSNDETEETDKSEHLMSDPYAHIWDVTGAVLFGLCDPMVDPTPCLAMAGSGLSFMAGGMFEDVDRGSETDSYAVFGDYSYKINDKLTLAMGLRYTHDEVDYFENTRDNILNPVGLVKGNETFTDVSPRFNVGYQSSSNTNWYATAAKGYKVGGFNPRSNSGETTFDEETGWNYELGVKTMLLDNTLRLNAAAFYFDWSDLQLRGQDVVSQRQFVQNADSASSQGVELEMMALLTDKLTLSAGYGYTKSEIDDFDNAISTSGHVFDASNNTIPYAPENTFNVSLNYDFEVFGFDSYARIDYSNMDDQYTNLENSESRMLEGYDLINAQLGFVKDNYSVNFYVKNAGDESYATAYTSLETYYTGGQFSVGEPRRMGMNVKYHF